MAKSQPHPTAGLPVRYGDCLLLKRIAKGGMAEIFFAELRGAGRFRRDVIVKRVLPQFSNDADFTRMLLEEARIAARLNHPNIVQVLNCGEHQGSTYLTLEFVDGVSLRGLLVALDKAGRTLPFDVTLYITLQVLQALDYAHTQKDRNGQPMHIVHRDVTPENILLGYSGEVKLTDFGVALATGRNHKTQAGVIKGKVYYLAPEQIHAKPVDHRLDQYVLGLVLYEVITGRRIFAGDSEAAVVNHVLDGAAAMFKQRPDMRTALGLAADVVLRAVQYDPRDRFANCYEMAAALNGLTTPGLLRDARDDLSKLLNDLFGAAHQRDMQERAELQAAAEDAEDAPPSFSDAKTTSLSPPAPPKQEDKETETTQPGAEMPIDEADVTHTVSSGELELLEPESLERHPAEREGFGRDMAMLGGVVVGAICLVFAVVWWLNRPSSTDVQEIPVRPSLTSSVPAPPPSVPPAPPTPATKAADDKALKAIEERLAKAEPKAAPPEERPRPVATAPLASKFDERPKPPVEEHPRPAPSQDETVEKPVEKPEKPDKPERAPKPEKPRPSVSKARSSLDVACLPWCEISINGQSLRQTSPLRNHRLAPGEYDIKVTNPPTGQSETRHVTVKAGEHVQIQFRL